MGKESTSPSKAAGGSSLRKKSEEETKTSKEEEKVEVELSPEDEALKERLEGIVETLQASDASAYPSSLTNLAKEIQAATSTMTAVPKPLKFLRPHFQTLRDIYTTWGGKTTDTENNKMLADILSVLSMTMAPSEQEEDAEKRICLHYKLAGHCDDLQPWGHEYLRALAGEIGQEYLARVIASSENDEEVQAEDLLVLVDTIVPHHMTHNAEAEAVDLLLEVQQLPRILSEGLVDSRNVNRVGLYLLRCTDFMVEEDLYQVLEAAYNLYFRHDQFSDALRVAMRMDDDEKVKALFSECKDTLMLAQMALMVSSHTPHIDFEELVGEGVFADVGGEESDDLAETLTQFASNARLSEFFLSSAKSLDMIPPKTPEDIYKTHLVEGHARWTNRLSQRNSNNNRRVDSAKENLASTFVNAFVNAGYGEDTLVLDESSDWIHRNKDEGTMCVSASLGLLMLWNVEDGLLAIDKYLYSNDDYVKAGGCLSIGMVTSRVKDESDSALALLSEYVEGGSESHLVRAASILGLGLAYAGTRREDVVDMLLPIVSDSDSFSNMVEVGLAALAVGMIYVGSCDEDAAMFITTRLMEATESSGNDEKQHLIGSPFLRLLSLGLALLFLGKQDKLEAIQEVVRALEDEGTRDFTLICLDICAYAGSGNVLQIQKLLQACSEHLTEKAEHQALAVLGIALVAFGEQISTEMSLRMFDHLLQYSELPIKRAVPLALGFLYVSNPDYGVIDQLSRLSHDADADVALSAVFSLGLVSAGTNNSRVAQLLRSLSDFYAQDDNLLFCVRVAQGLNAMGKGLLTLNPKHSDGLLIRPASMAALLSVCVCALDMKETFLNKRYHYLLFALTPAVAPRLLMALEKEDSPLLPPKDLETEEDMEAKKSVSLGDLTLSAIEVRVGQAVEVVGQAGKPRTITGFQTHMTPVQVSFGERAELEPILSSSGEKKSKKKNDKNKNKKGGRRSMREESTEASEESAGDKKGEEEDVEREYESLTQVLENVIVLRKRRKKTMKDLEGTSEGSEEESKEMNPNEA